MKTLPINLAPLAAFDALALRRKVFLVGNGAFGVTSQLTARLACERLAVRMVCGDNCFDPYAVTRYAKARGCRPADVLKRILIARAFTAYQLVELVERLEGYLACSELVIVTGICSAFFDDDLSDTDAARLFYRAFWKLAELSQSHMQLLLVESRALPIERRLYFLKDLYQTSEVVLSLAGPTTFTLEQKFNQPKRLHSVTRLLQG